LTLIVVPVMYTYLDAWHERRKAKRAARVAAESAAADSPAVSTLARAADD
jgi:hypothetical protein